MRVSRTGEAGRAAIIDPTSPSTAQPRSTALDDPQTPPPPTGGPEPASAAPGPGSGAPETGSADTTGTASGDGAKASAGTGRSSGPRRPPPGIMAQFAATREAAIRLVMAHVELAKAEASAIGGQVARLAGLIGIAIALVIMAAFLLVVGTTLFLGEWLFGSMGWGVLHGILAFASVAVTCILAAVGVPARSLAASFAGGVLVAIVVGVALGLDLPNRAYTAIGDATALGIDPGVRPLVVGLIVVGVLGLLLGLVGASRAKASVGAGAFGGLIAGMVLGAFTAITFGPQVGAALGIAAGYIAWLAFMGIGVSRTGIDTDAIKDRFYPTQTIETSKETLEWLQKRMPPGIR